MSDFSEILHQEAERHTDKCHMKKLQIFKIQDGGRPPFWKSFYRHSEKSSDFNEIWYTTSDIEPDYGHMTKIEIFKFEMAMAAILKIAFLAITH